MANYGELSVGVHLQGEFIVPPRPLFLICDDAMMIATWASQLGSVLVPVWRFRDFFLARMVR